MHFVGRDDTPDDFALMNLDQITRMQVRNEKRPDTLQVDIYLADGRKDTFKSTTDNGLLASWRTRSASPT